MSPSTSRESGTSALKAVAAIVSAGALALLVLYIGAKRENEKRADDLQKSNAELTQTIARQEIELKKLRVQVGEIERMRRDNAEIHQLRAASGELSKLRPENQKLQAEVEKLRGMVAQAQVESANFRKLQQEYETNQRKAKVALAGLAGETEKRTCIANLRQLAGAKQQWAIDNKRTARDVPGPADLFGSALYLKLEPTCPLGGGRYTLHSVGENPACSHPEHKL